MAQILRGDICWADLDPTKGHEQSGQRPVLILSNDIFNQRSGTVIAMALTAERQRAGFVKNCNLAETQKSSLIIKDLPRRFSGTFNFFTASEAYRLVKAKAK